MDRGPRWLLLLWTPVVAVALLAQEGRGQRVYTNSWAVLVPAGPQQAHRLARKHGFLNLGPVHWLEQQVAKRRTKRDAFAEPADPKFPQQWYLYNVNQRDLNVRGAWEQGYTGRGGAGSILDDGIEKNHPDLENNYVSRPPAP
nr:furin-like isoform X2 [Pelodiscus sinensis]XP_025034005.1 furin-like isoform X2 [Pelodiscus sinensis]|eukprot:XP_014435852.1 furin-like isoform X2 [Pelodiscus sinensis]